MFHHYLSRSPTEELYVTLFLFLKIFFPYFFIAMFRNVGNPVLYGQIYIDVCRRRRIKFHKILGRKKVDDEGNTCEPNGVPIHTQALLNLEKLISRLREDDSSTKSSPASSPKLPRSSPSSPTPSKKGTQLPPAILPISWLAIFQDHAPNQHLQSAGEFWTLHFCADDINIWKVPMTTPPVPMRRFSMALITKIWKRSRSPSCAKRYS